MRYWHNPGITGQPFADRWRFANLSDEELASIEAPTLVISGTDDQHTVKDAEALHERLPNSQLIRLPDRFGDRCEESVDEVEGMGNFNLFARSLGRVIDSFLTSNS